MTDLFEQTLSDYDSSGPENFCPAPRLVVSPAAGSGLFPLHPHQEAALDGLKRSLRTGHRRPVLELATAGGKTVIAAHIVAGALAKGNRVAFIVPMLNLIDQTLERFLQNGIDPGDIGVIQGDHEWRRPHAPVQICSAQTLARRGMPEASLLVVDEAHIRDAKLHAYLTDPKNVSVTAVGLSATPWAKGLGNIYDDLIRPFTMKDLIEKGYLCKFRVFAPAHPDLTGVKTDAKTGDYQTSDLAGAMGRPKIISDVVSTWLDKGEGRPTICFAVNRAHAALLNEQFNKNGVPSEYVDGETPRDDRKEVLARLESGQTKVVCNIGTMTTGVDAPFVSCLILARPTKSDSLFVQIVGRGLRAKPDGGDCIILDHSDTHLRLGMVTDISRAKLCTGKSGNRDSDRDEKIALPKECPQCGCLIPAAHHQCPQCGFEPKRAPGVSNEDGELVEFGAKRKKTKVEPVQARLIGMGKESIFRQIKHVASDRGWSPGRQSHAYRDIFGVWPRGFDLLPPEPPTMELLSWLRSRAISYAKSREVPNGR